MPVTPPIVKSQIKRPIQRTETEKSCIAKKLEIHVKTLTPVGMPIKIVAAEK
jgi:hypothetical protein